MSLIERFPAAAGDVAPEPGPGPGGRVRRPGFGGPARSAGGQPGHAWARPGRCATWTMASIPTAPRWRIRCACWPLATVSRSMSAGWRWARGERDEARAARYAWLETLRSAARCGNHLHGSPRRRSGRDRADAGAGWLWAGRSGRYGRRSAGTWFGPCFRFRRADLLQYLEEPGLSVWLDPANADPGTSVPGFETELLPMLCAAGSPTWTEVSCGPRTSRAATAPPGTRVLDALPDLDFAPRARGFPLLPPLSGAMIHPWRRRSFWPRPGGRGASLGPPGWAGFSVSSRAATSGSQGAAGRELDARS